MTDAANQAPSPALPLAVTMGDPAGIGIEITLKAWLRRQALRLSAFALYADPADVAAAAARLGIAVPLHPIDRESDATRGVGATRSA